MRRKKKKKALYHLLNLPLLVQWHYQCNNCTWTTKGPFLSFIFLPQNRRVLGLTSSRYVQRINNNDAHRSYSSANNHEIHHILTRNISIGIRSNKRRMQANCYPRIPRLDVSSASNSWPISTQRQYAKIFYLMTSPHHKERQFCYSSLVEAFCPLEAVSQVWHSIRRIWCFAWKLHLHDSVVICATSANNNRIGLSKAQSWGCIFATRYSSFLV